MKVRVIVPARNEARRLDALLRSVRDALAYAQARDARLSADLVVVLDRCSDRSRDIASAHAVPSVDCPAPYGKVEALRAGMRSDCDAHVCVDADVVLGPRTLFDMLTALLHEPSLLAACPPLRPEPLRGFYTPLAWALHRYNCARGFSSERLWLSGRCYALRGGVEFPSADEIRARAARVPRAVYSHDLTQPLVADDIWLSRALLAANPDGIRHVETDAVSFRAPSTLRGMSRTWRRLRRELRRVDLLFPELPSPGRDRNADSVRGVRDALALTIFRAALWFCKQHAHYEDWLHRRFGREPVPWPVVEESKS